MKEKLNLKKITNLAICEVAKIKGFANESEAILRLQEMGLLPGTEVTIMRKGPLGWPLELCVKGCRLALRKEEAELVYLED